MKEIEKLLEALFEAVVSGNIRKARRIAEKAIHQGLSAEAALEKMMDAMEAADRKYERKEYFVADVTRSASAMREALKVFNPQLEAKPAGIAGKIVIGSLKGNLQSIGKDTVKATLRAAGFEIVDLGVDVPADAFVDAVIREEAQVIGVSISVDETVPQLKGIVDRLRQENLADKVKIVIGGPAVSERTCETYGVDAYAKDALDCVSKVKLLLRSYRGKPKKR